MKTIYDIKTKIGFILLIAFLALVGLVGGLGTDEKAIEANTAITLDK